MGGGGAPSTQTLHVIGLQLLKPGGGVSVTKFCMGEGLGSGLFQMLLGRKPRRI